MINIYSLTTERIYIYIFHKSTFVLIDALEWKQQQRGSLINHRLSHFQHIPLIYYLNNFTCAINMHEYMSL